MKNIIIIILLVKLFFSMLFAAYAAGFKIYFSDARLANQTKRVVRMVFQRDSSIAKISLSPFGSFNANSFKMSAKGGFDAGTVFSARAISANISIWKLFRRDLKIKNLNIGGAVLNLNYENGRKFDYSGFFSNVKYLFINPPARQGFIKSVEIAPIVLSSGAVNLKTDRGSFVFSNVFLSADELNSGSYFSGSGSFDLETAGLKLPVVFKFRYSKEENIIYISDLFCAALSLSAEGKIKLLNDGSVEVEYVAKVNGEKLVNALAGFMKMQNAFNIPSNNFEEIIISYP